MPVGSSFYSIGLNLSASAHQPEIIQALKTRGDDVIQTSKGLCVRTSLSESELKELIGEVSDSLAIEKIDHTRTADLPPDVKAFIGG